MEKDKTTTRFLEIFDRLKSSHLLMLVGGLFVLDLFVPDPIPFIDEALLGLLTFLVARWKLRATAPEPAKKPPLKNVTPPDSRV
jgi:hypothetical protein